jgi:hypothetical protein
MVRRAKGKRSIYLENAQTDKLFAMVLALAGEVSVLRERLDTIEHLAYEKGLLSIAEIEAYQPDEETAQQREKWRQEYLARVLGVLQEEVKE